MRIGRVMVDLREMRIGRAMCRGRAIPSSRRIRINPMVRGHRATRSSLVQRIDRVVRRKRIMGRTRVLARHHGSDRKRGPGKNHGPPSKPVMRTISGMRRNSVNRANTFLRDNRVPVRNLVTRREPARIGIPVPPRHPVIRTMLVAGRTRVARFNLDVKRMWVTRISPPTLLGHAMCGQDAKRLNIGHRVPTGRAPRRMSETSTGRTARIAVPIRRATRAQRRCRATNPVRLSKSADRHAPRRVANRLRRSSRRIARADLPQPLIAKRGEPNPPKATLRCASRNA